MKASMQPHPEAPILVEPAANYFGSAGRVFVVRAQLPASGMLTLTGDRLIFEQENLRAVEIPLAEIHSLGMGRWHEPTGTFVPVLKVGYRKNLVFGVHVPRPERWIEAIEELAHRNHLSALQPLPLTSHRFPRGLRLLVAAVLILVLAASTLPAFLTRLGPRASHRLAGAPASAPLAP
jgi:hypothetical protein